MEKINLYDYLGNSIRIGIEVNINNLDKGILGTSLHSNSPLFEIDTSYISSQICDIDKQRELIKKVKEIATKDGEVNLIIIEEKNKKYQLLGIVNPDLKRKL